ncbi:hypothetical protein G6F35_016940 [Rhizopus arrhizus]|nr:hypothetical protein G6F35_016940 [Rhizopus arrhizus]
MSPPISGNSSESGKARFLGSASSGILELIIFHPVDTVAKRLMSNQNKIWESTRTFAENKAFADQVIFKEAANAGFVKKYASLFPGLGFAAGYKVAQRRFICWYIWRKDWKDNYARHCW